MTSRDAFNPPKGARGRLATSIAKAARVPPSPFPHQLRQLFPGLQGRPTGPGTAEPAHVWGFSQEMASGRLEVVLGKREVF